MAEKLRIFVSGKEGELDNERATAIEVINSLRFTPVGSEKRPASSDPMEEKFEGEVSTSDMYIGIFGTKYSEPTIKEFTTARANTVCTFVFEKTLSYGEEREAELDEFTHKIRDPQSGVVISKYSTVIDLRRKILEALTSYLAKKFKEARRLQREENIKLNEKLIEASKVTRKPNLAQKMAEFPIGTQLSEQFGKAEFVDFKFPSKVESAKTHLVAAKIRGSTKSGFLDLAIQDPDGEYYWFPDPLSYDSSYDNGKLSLDDGEHSSTWDFSIPPKKGKFVAIMGLYENNFKDRRCVNYEKREFSAY